MSQEAIRSLEHVRQRLNTLSTQLGSLRRDLEINQGLPAWSSIQNSATLLSHNLSSLNATLTAARPILNAAHAYPLPSFPGRTQEHSLNMLMRKKLQPPVEDWIEEGVNQGNSLDRSLDQISEHSQQRNQNKILNGKELTSLWDWAGPEGNRIAREIGEEAFSDVFTLAEQEQGIENVVTGLRRKFWEDEDEKEASGNTDGQELDTMDIDRSDTRQLSLSRIDEVDIDQTKPPQSLESMLKFTNTGIISGGIR